MTRTDPATASAGLPMTALETKTYSVSALIDAIRKGRIRIPRFQRRFRWDDDDRRLLFDSLQRGFPIGTLLLAKSAAPAGRIVLGGFVADVEMLDDALWVVDGQQRLATLAMGLLEDASGAYRPIFYDLDASLFVLGHRRRAPLAHWIPTSVLASSASLNKWLRQHGVSDDRSDRADEISRLVREYTVPAYIVPAAGENDTVLRDMFARINRSKHALTRAEVFDALNMSATNGKPFERVRNETAELGFGSLDRQIERTALAVGGVDPGATLDELPSELDVDALFSRVLQALRRTIGFLSEDVGVPHVSLLPYGGVLPALARFFDHFPSPHPRNRALLVRWFWRGMISGDHRTSNGIDRPKWAAIESDESDSIERLIRLLPPVSENDLVWEPSASLRSAAAKIELLAMADLEPAVLVGEEQGRPVSVATVIENGERWAQLGPDGSTASTLMHPGPLEVECLLANPPPVELLRTHAVSLAAFEALARNDREAFRAERSRTLADHLRSFLLEETGLDAPDRDRLPLDAYFREANDA